MSAAPQVGWVTTGYLEKLAATPIKRDLDITAARAISGAAFAAAMGAQTRPSARSLQSPS